VLRGVETGVGEIAGTGDVGPEGLPDGVGMRAPPLGVPAGTKGVRVAEGRGEDPGAPGAPLGVVVPEAPEGERVGGGEGDPEGGGDGAGKVLEVATAGGEPALIVTSCTPAGGVSV
jgi:hypothetical protein